MDSPALPPRAFVLGHPIAHSRSPLIHGHWLREHGIPGSYDPVDVAPEALPAFLRGMRAAGSAGTFIGGNVTIPHKEAARDLADVLTPTAARIGAVNTLSLDGDKRLVGDNTDAHGFVAHLAATLGAERVDAIRTALVLGAGGAARAVVAGLLDRGVERVLVANRTTARAVALTMLDPVRVVPLSPEKVPTALTGTDLLVNTTSLGMRGHPPLAIDLGPLRAGAAVADIVYVPLETPLLAAARARGCAAVDGLGMLLHQAAPGFERWFGVRPTVTPRLRALVVADLERRG